MQKGLLLQGTPLPTCKRTYNGCRNHQNTSRLDCRRRRRMGLCRQLDSLGRISLR